MELTLIPIDELPSVLTKSESSPIYDKNVMATYLESDRSWAACDTKVVLCDGKPMFMSDENGSYKAYFQDFLISKFDMDEEQFTEALVKTSELVESNVFCDAVLLKSYNLNRGLKINNHLVKIADYPEALNKKQRNELKNAFNPNVTCRMGFESDLEAIIANQFLLWKSRNSISNSQVCFAQTSWLFLLACMQHSMGGLANVYLDDKNVSNVGLVTTESGAYFLAFNQSVLHKVPRIGVLSLDATIKMLAHSKHEYLDLGVGNDYIASVANNSPYHTYKKHLSTEKQVVCAYAAADDCAAPFYAVETKEWVLQ